MNRWLGKIAVVTGASSGIGLAIAKKLVCNGMIVVGLARRKTKMEAEMREHTKKNGKFIAYQCDLTKAQNINDAFQWIQNNLGVVHVLVNNAGTLVPKDMIDTPRYVWENIFNINVIAYLDCAKHAVDMMKAADIEGHIINMNSIVGHNLDRMDNIPRNVYPASKYAVTSLTHSLQKELRGGKIRVTSVSPGFVATEIAKQEDIDVDLSDLPRLESEDVADAVIYIIGTPKHVQVTELIIRPLGENM